MALDVASKAYGDILTALNSVTWHLFGGLVTPIGPMGHKEVNFFPGQCGFSGHNFPVGGVMMVGNNFSNLAGWNNYRQNLDYHDVTKTWKRLNDLILPATGLGLDEFWFTNYSLGVMDRPDASYVFPARIRKGLDFKSVFETCVAAMHPRLIVALGADAAWYIGADYVGMGTHRTPSVSLRYGCPTIATLHPAARHASNEQFISEGKRIGELCVPRRET